MSLHFSAPPAPRAVFVHRDGGLRGATRAGTSTWHDGGAEIRWEETAQAGAVIVASPHQGVSRLVLRWSHQFDDATQFLGDAWERGYGDLQWRHLDPNRILPWYFLATGSAPLAHEAWGVHTQPNAFCFWLVDGDGISLWLDLRNGSGDVRLGARELLAATVVQAAGTGMSAFAFATAFCRQLCPHPRLAAHPVCGNNNWYYAYGENFDASAIRRDAHFLANISAGAPHRPYSVIDAGWTTGGVAAGGPWTHSDATRFPDMGELAAKIQSLGVRAGLWLRLSALSRGEPRAGRLRFGPHPGPEQPLDLTLAANLATIAEDVARVRSWGYGLLKHDFSTYDSFGRWGFEMGAELTSGAWHWADASLTNAEVLLRFYRLIREQAGDMIVLGCNTVGHLAAGLVEVQRVGDDTSGKNWERTRRMGINSLAFRLPQHGAFFALDADCAAHTAATPWEQDRQFLDLVARSGTALFISTDPSQLTAEKETAFRAAMQLALRGGQGATEPLDWLTTTCPQRWTLGGQPENYVWFDAAGASPFY